MWQGIGERGEFGREHELSGGRTYGTRLPVVKGSHRLSNPILTEKNRFQMMMLMMMQIELYE